MNFEKVQFLRTDVFGVAEIPKDTYVLRIRGVIQCH